VTEQRYFNSNIFNRSLGNNGPGRAEGDTRATIARLAPSPDAPSRSVSS
jgi:hypothetical protein